MRLLAARRRWEAKLPHNRVRVRHQRDESGRRIGRFTEPWPEPVVPAVYREICGSRYDVQAEYDNARHGVPADEVRPLGIPEAVLRDWAARLN